MTSLVMLLVKTKSDVLNALKMKSFLAKKDIEVTGMVIQNATKGPIPSEFLEELTQLKVVGFLKEN